MFEVGDVVKVVRGEPSASQTYVNGDMGVVHIKSTIDNNVIVRFFRDGEDWYVYASEIEHVQER